MGCSYGAGPAITYSRLTLLPRQVCTTAASNIQCRVCLLACLLACDGTEYRSGLVRGPDQGVQRLKEGGIESGTGVSGRVKRKTVGGGKEEEGEGPDKTGQYLYE